MKLIVGLGNPGGKYQYTRHNIGFMVIDNLIAKLNPSTTLRVDGERSRTVKTKNYPFAEVYIFNDLILAKPQTYINNSGLAVSKLASIFKLPTSHLWVVHDDIDLPLGKIRIRMGGASAGHNGVDSIIKALGTDKFLRFRLGIGRGKMEKERTMDQNLHRRWVEKYVLSPFWDDEGGKVRVLIKKAAEAVELAIKEGIEKAMNKYN